MSGRTPDARSQCRQVDAQLIDQPLPAVGELVVPLVEAADGPGGQQPVAQLHAAASGQVVVTRPGVGQRAGCVVFVSDRTVAGG